MNRTFSFCILLLFVLLTSNSALALDKVIKKNKVIRTDELYLKNGNMVTGEITKLLYGILTYKTDDIGTIQIKWKDVRRLKSTKRFEFTLSNNEMHIGSIDDTSTNSDLRQLLLLMEEDTLSISMDDLVRIVPIKNTFLSRIDGNINAGFSFSKATAFLQFTGSAYVEYRAVHDKIYLDGSSNVSWDKRTDDTTTIILIQDAMLGNTHYFNHRWYIQSYFGLDQNTELGLNLRISLAALGGKALFQNRLHTMNTGLGILGSRETPTTGDISYLAEGIINLEYRIYKYTYPRVILTSVVNAYPSLSDPGRIRVKGDTNIQIDFVKDFIFTLGTYQTFDNRPATEGASTYDWGVTATVGYTF